MEPPGLSPALCHLISELPPCLGLTEMLRKRALGVACLYLTAALWGQVSPGGIEQVSVPESDVLPDAVCPFLLIPVPGPSPMYSDTGSSSPSRPPTDLSLYP